MKVYAKNKARYVRRKASVKPTVKKAVRKAKVASFNKRVKRVLYRQAETKIANYSANGRAVLTTKSSNFDGLILNLLPDATGSSQSMINIQQSDLQGGREGNDIQPTSIMLSGVLRTNNYYDSTTNYNPCPVRVCMWVFQLKKHLHDVVTTVSSVIQNSFFQNGGSSIGFTGTTVDLTRFVNSDQITLIKKRVFLLGNSQYSSAFGSGSGSALNQFYANNDANQSQMFRVRIQPPKRLLFNDGTDTPVNARRMWLMFTSHRVDGAESQTSLGAVTGPIPAYVDLSAEFRYKDF